VLGLLRVQFQGSLVDLSVEPENFLLICAPNSALLQSLQMLFRFNVDVLGFSLDWGYHAKGVPFSQRFYV
jgi:hypothetical protein